MTDKVTLTQTERVVTTVEKGTIVVTGVMGPPGSGNISDSGDIDLSGLVDGATLVYSAPTAKWQATNLLEKQIMNGGFF